MPSKRPRRSFDLDDDLQDQLPERGLSAFVNEALRIRLRPPYYFAIPDDIRQEPFPEFLERASHELTFLGNSLSALTRDHLDRLRARIGDRLRMSFYTLNPEMDRKSPVAQVLSVLLGGAPQLENVLAGAAESQQALASLKQEADALGVDLRVFTHEEVLPCGLIVADRSRPTGVMRVNLYTSYDPGRMHPYLIIDAGVPAGALIFHEYIRYLTEFAERANRVR